MKPAVYLLALATLVCGYYDDYSGSGDYPYCEEIHVEIGDPGTPITSPRYPHKYKSNLYECWVVHSPHDVNIFVETYAFAEHDFLNIYEGTDSDGELVDHIEGHGRHVAHSTSGQMFIEFVTDQYDKDDGFVACICHQYQDPCRCDGPGVAGTEYDFMRVFTMKIVVSATFATVALGLLGFSFYKYQQIRDENRRINVLVQQGQNTGEVPLHHGPVLQQVPVQGQLQHNAQVPTRGVQMQPHTVLMVGPYNQPPAGQVITSARPPAVGAIPGPQPTHQPRPLLELSAPDSPATISGPSAADDAPAPFLPADVAAVPKYEDLADEPSDNKLYHA